MLICKTGVSQKEKRIIENIFYNTIDLYSDAYITRNNVRISIRENADIFIQCLNKGDKWIYDINREDGLAMITGTSDKSPRIYVKILTKDLDLANNFLKIIAWNTKSDLYAKIKKNNPLAKVFQRNGYKFMGDRGSEILLCRKYIARPEKSNMRKIKGEEDGQRNTN